MKAVQPVIASYGVSYVQIMSVGSHIKSERGKERKKLKIGLNEGDNFYPFRWCYYVGQNIIKIIFLIYREKSRRQKCLKVYMDFLI